MASSRRYAWGDSNEGPTFDDVRDAQQVSFEVSDDSNRRNGVSSRSKPQRKQAIHNLNGSVIREFGPAKQSTGPFKKITSLYGSTEKIKKDKLVLAIYLFNVVIIILNIVAFVKYGSKVPDEHKTPIGYTIATGLSYLTIGGLTIYQMYQISRRIEPDNRPQHH